MENLIDVTRKEKKYLISQITASRLYELISGVLKEDANNNFGMGYMVRSLYFDTLDDKDYFEKSEGYETRRKIRLRTYSTESEYVKLELKEKIGDNQRKQSLKISKEHALLMINGEYECLLLYNNELARQLYYYMLENVYQPKCIVEYNRKAFFVQENDTRITFDSNIKATESNFDIFSKELMLYPVANIDDVALEVKYDKFLLSYVKDMVTLCDKTQISYGKYWLGRAITMNNGIHVL